jgi:hypothetical protein
MKETLNMDTIDWVYIYIYIYMCSGVAKDLEARGKTAPNKNYDV